ncbi:methyltransferase domain-containing protein [Sediminicoccus rosea]|jgi:SAM-dependent methyltransferase|uniref:Methyltransferase domain-containing protein n=1 Tax=Sediminicoccus rosea TaxID=1225128 RepID=A0ABZ0PGJ8_9PROT|nr:methyltransferase domain-containing protein [Sediminicoccus rosea]WPB84737.1 methyltransferase domain-containing protein [Sediminicoccus rosea]
MAVDPKSTTQVAAGGKAPPVCPCCGGTRFGPGPGGRMSRRGRPPTCLQCGSLERHRAGRQLIDTIRDRAAFKEFSLLDFGDIRVVAGGWFRSIETSAFGSPGAIDPQAIDRPDGSYGFIICYHVLTRVPDHRKALGELTRILSPDGLLVLAYPSPATRAETTDWGAPDPKQHGSYRILGRDFEPELSVCTAGAHVLAVKAVDPVTADDDLVYIVTKDFRWVRRILATKVEVRLLD